MKNFSILGLFQHCAHCGSLTFERRHLCQRCLQRILDKIKIHRSKPLKSDWVGFPFVYLVSYKERIAKAWVLALKGGSTHKDYRFIASEWMQSRNLIDLIELTTTTIIPAPSRSGKIDHAGSLARELSLISGWKIKNILEYQQVGSTFQKTKKVTDRGHIAFNLQCALTEFERESRFIFVDDILTTGSTAEAAWRALGKPAKFEVWCIAYQPKLAVPESV